MNEGTPTGVWPRSHKALGPEEEKLDRALVTGLMLEVVMETATLKVDPQTHRQLVKTRLKDSLVANLAGRVTLERFRHLLRQLDRWFPRYYPLITAGPARDSAPAAPASPARQGLREDRLRAWLEGAGRDLLPHRPHSKLKENKLWDFLQRTQGNWFQMKCFQQHFSMDRKTAWEYLQKFLQVGLLRHNGARSAAVRYALAPHFLVVRADLLEPKVREALSDLDPTLMEQVSAWLIATGGEAFWEREWHRRLDPAQGRRLITRLLSAGVLKEVCRVGDSPMLRLARAWLQD